MKHILYSLVIIVCVATQFFIAREEMRRDEKLLKVPPFIATEHKREISPYKNPIIDASEEQVKSALLPLVNSESVEKAAELLKGVSEIRAREIVDMVLSDKDFQMSPIDQRIFIAAVGAHYKGDPSKQAAFFEVILKHPSLYQDEPFIATLLGNGYEQAVPWILTSLDRWGKEKKFVLPEGLLAIVNRTYTWIIDNNDMSAIKYLLQAKIKLDAKTASELLWKAASLPKSDARFVEVLTNQGADVSFSKDGFTVLMKAVLNDNLPFVKALVEKGAAVDVVIDSAVGSALQLAIEKGFVNVELYLRSHGAQL